METTKDSNELKKRIAAWLAVTKGEDISVGLTEEEAARRAKLLLDSILDGNASLESVTDDDFKHVLSIVVALLRDREGAGDTKLRDANAVYQFIRRLPWPEDAF